MAKRKRDVIVAEEDCDLEDTIRRTKRLLTEHKRLQDASKVDGAKLKAAVATLFTAYKTLQQCVDGDTDKQSQAAAATLANALQQGGIGELVEIV